MFQRPSTEKKNSGSALIEALIGMLILLLCVGGTVVALGNGAKVQNGNNLRAQAIDQVRGIMMDNGIDSCGKNVALPMGTQSLSVPVTCTTYSGVQVSFAGVAGAISIAIPATQAQIITATITSDAIGGSMVISSNQ
jgi:Tfp pilus assembly protein PilV